LPLLTVVQPDGSPLPFPGPARSVGADEITSPFVNPQPMASSAPSSDLLYSTYLGGLGTDFGSAIAVDSTGATYVTDYTNSLDFPTTPGAFETTYNGGN